MTKKQKQKQIAAEEQQQLAMNPIAAGECHREQLGAAAAKALREIDPVTGVGLSRAVEADRLYIGFSHDGVGETMGSQLKIVGG
jgi:hypothetical protein